MFVVPPPPQVCGAVHVPHETLPPHPSGWVPQFCVPVHFAAGVQPHTLGVPPPPQVCGAVQLPQLSVPPHPSDMVPQFRPPLHVVAAVQQVSSVEVLLLCKQMEPVGQLFELAVHWTQAP